MPSSPPQANDLHDRSAARDVPRALVIEGKHLHFEKQEGGGHATPFVVSNQPSSIHVEPRSSTSVPAYDADGNEGPPPWYRVSYSTKGDGLAASSQPLTTRNLTEYNETNSLATPQSAIEQARHRHQALEAALLQLEVQVSQEVLAGSAKDYVGMEPLARFLIEDGHWCSARPTPHSARGPDS